jgi:outer membrane protein
MKYLLGTLFVCGLSYAAQAADLMHSYQLAKQNDPQIRAAAASRMASYEARPQALAALLPNVSLSGEANVQDLDVSKSTSGAYDDNYDTNSLALNITQPLYRKDRSVILEQADDQVNKADADYLVAQQGLILRVAQAYFGVLSAQDDVGFAQTEKKAIAQQLEQAKERFDVGLVAITDVYETQARYDQAHASEISALNELGNAHEALREITQQVPDSLAVLQDGMQLVSPEPADINVWSQKARQNNAAIRAAILTSDLAYKNIQLKEAGHHPTLDFVGSLNRSRSDADFGSDTDTGYIGLQLALPIYSGGGVDSSVRQAHYEHQAATESLEQQRRAVERQVRDAYRGIQTSISRVQALQATQTSAQSALDATQAGFEAGTRTLVDVLNSQRDLYRAQRDYAQSRYGYVLNTLSLLQAAGTLSEQDLRQVNAWLE